MLIKVMKKFLFLFILTCLTVSFNSFIPLPASFPAFTIENPDPLRFQDEISVFNGWDQKNSFPLHGILFVGSSSIRLWHTHQAFPVYPLINRGFGGAHISDVLYYYDHVVEKYQPQLIIFYAGDNDVAAGKKPEQVFADFREFLTMVQDDFPRTNVVYLPIKPSTSRWKFWEIMQKANQMIETYAAENKNLYFIDTASVLLGSDGKPDPDLFLDDHLHLNEQGYKRWNEVLAPILRKLYTPYSK